jgi:diguanylate cyclase (GGDEF)-like protein
VIEPDVTGQPILLIEPEPQFGHFRGVRLENREAIRSVELAAFDSRSMPKTLEQLVSSDRLPSLPQVAVRVLEIARSEDPDIEDLVRTIKSDPGISSRILLTVNSALFGLRQRVSSIEAAVPVLGLTLVRTLVLSFSLANFCKPSAHHQRRGQRLWRAAITQAVVAERLAEEVDGADSAVWFLAGLLQDVGRLAMLCGDPEEYGRLMDARDDGTGLVEAEATTFGFTHVDVTLRLAERWRLDHELISAIRGHPAGPARASSARQSSGPPNSAVLPIALRLAALVADYMESLRSNRTVPHDSFEIILSETFRFSPHDIPEFLDEVNQRVSEIAVLFAIDVGEVMPVHELLAAAQAALGDIAMRSQLEAVAANRRAKDAAHELARVKSESTKLLDEASRDPLTGALSRRGLRETIAGRLGGRRYQDRRLGVVFMDVDKFKSINDNFGHQVGDEVLRRLVHAIRSNIREEDGVYRFGGDEFVIVLSTCSESLLARIAERIRASVEDARCASVADLTFTTSVGLVICDPAENEEVTPDRILEEADRAMYAAKKRGGNQVAVFRWEGDTVVPIQHDDWSEKLEVMSLTDDSRSRRDDAFVPPHSRV